MKTRREFILDTCKICFLVGTAGVAASFLESCNSIKTIAGTDAGDNKISIPLKSFDGHPQVMVSQKNSETLIIAIKKTDGTYTAMPMTCTHKGQPLTVKDGGLYCASHGSTFDLNGGVTHGPATRSIANYPTSTTETDLVIEVKKG